MKRDETIRTSYRVTKKDIYRAYLLHIRPRKLFAILGILMLCLCIFSCILAVVPLEGEPNYVFAGFLLVTIVLLMGGIYVLPWFSIHRSIRQTKGVDGEVKVVVGEDSIQFSGEYSHITIPYSHVFAVKSDKDYLLIYTNQNVFRIVPKYDAEQAGVADQIEQALARLG